LKGQIDRCGSTKASSKGKSVEKSEASSRKNLHFEPGFTTHSKVYLVILLSYAKV